MDPLFSPDELAQLRAYRDPQYLWALFALPLQLLSAGALVLFSGRIYRFCEGLSEKVSGRLGFVHRVPVLRAFPAAMNRIWRGAGWGAAIVFTFVTFALPMLASLPMQLRLGHFHERAFGMSTESLGAFLEHWSVSTVLGGAATALAVIGMLGLARRTRHWWWVLGLVCALGLLGSAALDPYRSRLHFEQQPLAAGPLRTKLEALLNRAQVEFDDLHVEKTSKRSVRINAYFAGQGQTRRIVLGDTLLHRFTDEEIVAVVAHEAAHVHESRWPSYLGAALGLIAFLLLIHRLFAWNVRRAWYPGAEYGDVRMFPLISLSFILLTGMADPVSSYFSRERELAADRYAVELLEDDAAFRSMLIKSARINRMDPDPPRWLVLRTFSHPPIRDRLAALESRTP